MRSIFPRIKCKRDAVCHKLKWYQDDENVILNMVTYCVSILTVINHYRWVSGPAWNSHVAKRIPVELLICFYYCARGKPRVQFTIRVSPFTQKPIACKPAVLVCMTPWMRNWSLASRAGLSVTVRHVATVLLGNRVCFLLLGFPLLLPQTHIT